MNKFMVLGASSFSGTAFIRYLLSRGDKVRGLSRPDYDVNTRVTHIMAEVRKFEPDYVVNFAALNMVAESWDYWSDYYHTNLQGLGRLHRALAEWGGLARYVQVSTPEVYGATLESLREDAPFRPSTPYAVSRAACDMDLLCLHRQMRFPVCFTRTVNVYGPGQQTYRIIPKTVLSIARGGRLTLHGGGVSERDFIHIDDFARAAYMVATKGASGETYHIATGKMVSIRRLVEMVCALMGVKFDEHVDVGEERPGKDPAYWLSDAKIRSRLGWHPTVELQEGLAETVNYFATHAERLREKPLEYEHRA